MNKEEKALLDMLGDAFMAYCKLPRERTDGHHPDDLADFRYHIHRLQDMVAARTAYRIEWAVPKEQAVDLPVNAMAAWKQQTDEAIAKGCHYCGGVANGTVGNTTETFGVCSKCYEANFHSIGEGSFAKKEPTNEQATTPVAGI